MIGALIVISSYDSIIVMNEWIVVLPWTRMIPRWWSPSWRGLLTSAFPFQPHDAALHPPGPPLPPPLPYLNKCSIRLRYKGLRAGWNVFKPEDRHHCLHMSGRNKQISLLILPLIRCLNGVFTHEHNSLVGYSLVVTH